MMEWNNNRVLEFLELLEEEPVIWKVTHPGHKVRDDVYDAWKRIEMRMGNDASVKELKRKKDSLMASFRIAVKRAKSSVKCGGGSEEIHKPIWFAYEKMASFLSDKDEPRKTMDSEGIETAEVDEDNDYYMSDSQKESNAHQQVARDGGEIHPTASGISGKQKIKKMSSNRLYLNEIKSKMDTAYAHLMSIRDIDYCDKYGEIVAYRLRELDEWHRDAAINKIDNILYEVKSSMLARRKSTDHQGAQSIKSAESDLTVRLLTSN